MLSFSWFQISGFRLTEIILAPFLRTGSYGIQELLKRQTKMMILVVRIHNQFVNFKSDTLNQSRLKNF